MPYKAGSRLPGERSSKLGHLEVIDSPLVKELVDQFEKTAPAAKPSTESWEPVGFEADPLRLIFAVDGSIQAIQSEGALPREVAFVKTALLRLDQLAVSRLDAQSPNPFALRDLMTDAALYHATVFPLRGIALKSENNYNGIRRIIFQSLRDKSLDGEPFATLKWLAFEKWSAQQTISPGFQCPSCDKDISGLPYDSDMGHCPSCGGDVFLSDMLGFHLEMGDDAAPVSVATAYMLIHETLMLFTGIRHFWERGKFNVLSNCLFLKDGPLTLRGQYSKLVIPIRKFFEFSKTKGIDVHVVGQEKTGAFVDHLDTLARFIPANSLFLPPNKYIREQIQRAPERGEPYGSRTNYGNKLLLKIDEHHHLVLSIPTGEYTDNVGVDRLIGVHRILSTVKNLRSYRHECALVPIELANGVASLSSYPSAKVLKLFAEI